MKIMHLISGGDVGGAKTHVLSLLHGLLETEQIQLVCFMEGAFAQEARELGILTAIKGERNVLQVAKALAREINDGGYDVIHCHGSRANLIGSLIREKIHAPLVTTVHSDYRLDYLGRTFHRLTYGTINTICLRQFKYHIGVSRSMVRLLTSRGFNPQTMFPIYNGVEFTEIVPPMNRQEYLDSLGVKTDENTVTFGIAARLSAVKDVGTLIRGFSIAVKQAPHMRLIIAGDGEQSEELHKLAEDTCPAGTVCFAGWVSDMASFYNAMDVNTLTSLSETFPYALTEGARQHCATIASSVGGVPDLIEHGVTGLLFEAQDAKKLAENMVAMATDSALRKKLADGLNHRAKMEYSVEATVSRQREIYGEIRRKYERNPGKRDGVLICGAYGKGNAGDDAILEAILHQMGEIDGDMPITVLTRTPKATRIRYGIDAVHTFNVPKYLHVMGKTKLYINGGGSLIQDVTSSRSLHYYLSSIRWAKRRGNQVLMYGCGIGPVSRPGNVKKATKIINRYVDAITLREETSKKELEKMGVTRPDIQVTADPALLLPVAKAEKVDGFFLANGLDIQGKYLMFVIRPWEKIQEKLPYFVAVAEKMYETHNLTPVFLALEPNRDLAVSEQAVKALNCPGVVLPVPKDGDMIVGIMGRMTAVVAMRLHALIFAAAVGTPVVGAVYDPKVQAFMDCLGQTRYLQFGDLEEATLERAVESALSDGEHDRNTVAKLRTLAAENGKIAKKLLEEAK